MAFTLNPGTILHSPTRDYTIVRTLGQGGFGITYLVESPMVVGGINITARFAIKELFLQVLCERHSDAVSITYPNSARTEVTNALRAFVSEANRLQKLGIEHDNIVKVGDVFEANNTAYYVMEYLDGVTLTEYVRQRQRLSFAEAESLLRPLFEAVATLHAQSVAHYDIKPHNIMIVEKDGRQRAVLIDFGLAKHYDGQGQATSSMMAAGYTPGYAPVEQYTGIRRFAPTADVYALSATMLYCLTGHTPAKADELNLDAVCDELLDLGLEPERANELLRALEYRPGDRHPDAGAFTAALFGVGTATIAAKTRLRPVQPTVRPAAKPAPAKPAAKRTPAKKANSNSIKVFSAIMIIFMTVVAIVVTLSLSKGGSDYEYEDRDSVYTWQEAPVAEAPAPDTVPAEEPADSCAAPEAWWADTCAYE